MFPGAEETVRFSGRMSLRHDCDGTEGALYNVHEYPNQWRNLWVDPDYASIRDDLVRDL